MKVGDIIQSAALDSKHATKRKIVADEGNAWIVSNLRGSISWKFPKDVIEANWKVVDDARL